MIDALYACIVTETRLVCVLRLNCNVSVIFAFSDNHSHNHIDFSAQGGKVQCGLYPMSDDPM